MRSKTLKFLVILFFVAIISTFTITVVFAATTNEQPAEIKVENLGTYSFKPNQFGYWYSNTTWGDHFTDTELIHISSNLVAAGSYEQKGEFFLNMKVPDNFINASKNGYLQIGASAQVKSYDYNWTDATDCIDINLESGEYNGKKRDEFVPKHVDKFEINTDTYTPVSVNMTKELQGNGLTLRFYIHPTTYSGYVYSYIKDPKLTVSTTDHVAPTVIASIDNNEYSNKNKKLTIKVADNESGINYVLVNGQKQAPTKVDNNTKNVEIEIDVAQNGLYEIVAYDNVGNISATETFVESKIDKDIPTTPTITVPRDWTGFSQLSVQSVFSDNGTSPAKLVYTFGEEVPTYSSAEIVSQNSVITIGDDNKKINFAMIDAAGNISDIVTKQAYDVFTKAENGNITGGGRFLHGYVFDAQFGINEGTKLNRVVANGRTLEIIDGNKIQIEVVEDTLIEVIIKAPVNIEILSSQSVYNSKAQKPIIKDGFADGTYDIIIDEAISIGEYDFEIVLNHETYYGKMNGTFVIVKSPLNVTCLEARKSYQAQDPQFEYIIEGLFEGDSLTGNLQRQAGEDSGQYEILLGSLNNPNYEINYISNYLTINKGTITVASKNHSKKYGESDCEFEYVVSGLVNGDTLEGKLERVHGENAGIYSILQGSLRSQNYDILFYGGKFSIEKNYLPLILEDMSSVYTGNPFEDFGLQTDVDIKVIYRIYREGRLVNSAVDSGEYTVEAFFAGNRNYYETTSNKVKLVIDRQKVEITISQDKFVYDGKAKSPKYSISANTKGKTVLSGECFEIGVYDYVIEVDNQNYFGSANGKFEIINNVIYDDGENKVIYDDEKIVDSIQMEKIFDDSQKVDTFNSKYVVRLKSSNELFGSVKVNMQMLDLKGKEVKLFARDKDGNLHEVDMVFNNDTLSFSARDSDVEYVVLYGEEPQEPQELNFWVLVGIVIGGIALILILGIGAFYLKKKLENRKEQK